MTAIAFGFAAPLSFNDLKPGMLVLAAPGPDQRYFGVVAKLGHDAMLIVLSATDGPTPGPLDLGHCVDSLWMVPGNLEVEPEGVPFLPSNITASPPSFMIDSTGFISALVVGPGDFGPQRYAVDLNTGEVTKGTGKIAYFKGARFYVRQEGRRDRFEWPDFAQAH